ncbi:MAG: type II toxin-antitoxin system prevent-host-death family antitoxin [Actinobacteria bacterium]|nr:type II toxin-antitoxin system prevent-host-death family antitoxin [Actinomycetota bacterium]
MSTISHREMRNNSAEVLRRVEAGETITVTNHGRDVAQITPIRRTAFDEAVAQGQVRRATHDPSILKDIKRVRLESGETTADIIADVRGYDRGY